MREKFSILLCSLLLVSAAAFTTQNANAANAPKEWTFMVYLNGFNNLDSFGSLNINQMEMVGSSDKVNVVVQWASDATQKVSRLYIKKDNDPTTVTSPVIQELGTVDMGDYHSLADFIAWGAKNYPANHYVVDVWDHGSGWHAYQNQLHTMSSIFHPTDISWDEISGHHITTKELGMALSAGAQAIGHKIDIYGSDACLMAMAEVAAEMKDSVSYFVGSQDLEPGAGWPYDQMLKSWYTKTDGSPRSVAIMMANEYTRSYMGGSNGSQQVTGAAYDLSKMDAFEQSIRDLGAEMMKLDAPSRAKVIQAMNSTSKFTYNDYADLVEFTGLVAHLNLNVDRSALDQVRGAASQLVIANAVTDSWQNHANGVSFWLPSDKGSYGDYINLYQDLNFDHGTGWSQSVNYLIQDSSRR